MSRKGVTQEQIFTIAYQIAINNYPPTVTKIRQTLGTGSKATVHKYFERWKKECFKKSIDILNTNSVEPCRSSETKHELIENNLSIKQAINKQLVQNEFYAQELINAEKANIFLKEDNNQLQVQLQVVQLELKESRAINNTLEQITIEIKNKLENNDNKTIQNLQQTIEELKAELKKLNETSLEALREASTKGHEALMQEKVTSINLQAKVDSLYKELTDSKKQLFDATLKYQAQIQAFSRQIDWQQRIIQEHIGLDKLEKLFGGSELMLNFNVKTGVAYAK